jgi:hypothetical protein
LKNDRRAVTRLQYKTTISYEDALHEVPQIRSIAKLYYVKQYSRQETMEIDELHAILKLQSPDCFINRQRLNYLVGKYHVRALPLDTPARPHRKPKFKGEKPIPQAVISSIYFSPYKRV